MSQELLDLNDSFDFKPENDLKFIPLDEEKEKKKSVKPDLPSKSSETKKVDITK